MKNRTLRLALVLLALAATGGAGFYVFGLEQRAAALREADRVFTEDVLRLQATLADLRASQAGYLAAGQDAAFWIERVAKLRQDADQQWQRLTPNIAPSPGESPDVADLLRSFGRADDEVLSLLRSEGLGDASERIFGSAAMTLGRTTSALASARGAHAAATGAGVADMRRHELYAVLGAAALVVLTMLLLLPRGGGTREAGGQDGASDVPQQAEHTSVGIPAEDRRGLGLDFALAPSVHEPAAGRADAGGGDSSADGLDAAPVPGTPTAGPLERAHAPAPPGHAAPAVERVEAPPGIDLSEAARLCTDLARVQDTSELQGLLARAATLLHASGIVVWMAAAETDVLWPAFSHGYSPQALARMRALPRDGATPVSVAFRKGLVEVVPGGPDGTGAVVVPIVTSGGCVGAMAVELRPGAEPRDPGHALARIVAAQLATLVAGES